MRYMFGIPVSYHRNNIETYLGVYPPLAHIIIGRKNHALLFLYVHCGFRGSEKITAPRFYLHEDQFFSLRSYYIYFYGMYPEPALQNDISAGRQVIRCHILTLYTQGIRR